MPNGTVQQLVITSIVVLEAILTDEQLRDIPSSKFRRMFPAACSLTWLLLLYQSQIYGLLQEDWKHFHAFLRELTGVGLA